MTPNATYHDIETLSGPSQLAAITKLTETNAQYTLNSNVAKFIKAATTYADLFLNSGDNLLNLLLNFGR